MISASRIQTTSISIPTLKDYYDEGKLTFSNPIQRNLVWKNLDRSKLVYSIVNNVRITEVVANKSNDKDDNKKVILDVLDGKQRLTSLIWLVQDKFTVEGIDVIVLESGEEIDLNGLKFSEFPEYIKTMINTYMINFITYDNLDEDECREVFALYNSGVALSATEKLRGSCHAFNDVSELSQHKIFETLLTEKAIEKYKANEIIWKMLMLMKHDEPDFGKKLFEPFVEILVVTDEDKERLATMFDRYLNAYELINKELESSKVTTDKQNLKKVLTKIARQIHIISLANVLSDSLDNGMTNEQFADFLKYFFTAEGRKCSISQRYNQCLSSGTGKKDKIATRKEELQIYFGKFVEDNFNK